MPMMNENCVVLSITKKYIGFTRVVKSDQVEVQANKKWIQTQKSLWDNKDLNAVWGADERVQARLSYFCLPSPFARGMFLVPIPFLSQVEDLLTKHVETRKELVEKFLSQYDVAKESAKEQLGVLYNAADYPSIEVARGRFEYSWQYTDFGVSPKLEAISRDLFLKEQKKAQEQWEQATEEIQQLLRANMADLVANLITKLTPAADGSRRRFSAASVEKVQNFIREFSARNIANDTQLEALIEKTRALSEGMNPEDLKTSDAARAQTKQAFEQVQTALNSMIVNGPRRFVQFEDEAELEQLAEALAS